jgi:hypothetical protein
MLNIFSLFAVMTEPIDFIKKESIMGSHDSWSKSDIVEWICNGYGANREQMENLSCSNGSDLLNMLTGNPEEYAKILGMGTATLQQACKSIIENSAHTYLPTGHVYPNNGK